MTQHRHDDATLNPPEAARASNMAGTFRARRGNSQRMRPAHPAEESFE
jgi:hypothetical protein